MSFATVIERLQRKDSPYPGLRAFDVSESHLFFGRDPQVAQLVKRLERNRFVAVLGVSGSGKSSLVRAGLIPALERGGVWEAGRRWRRVITQPGAAPFESLAADLRRAGIDANAAKLRESSHGLLDATALLPPDETLLLVVDQFEELFRYKDLNAVSPAARQLRDQRTADAAEFVQLLLESTRHHPPIYVVLTMRSDYVGDCAAFRDLPETLNDCQFLVPRMTREQRKEAIEGPLGRVRMSSVLVQRLLNDVGDEPDMLPVLQHALMRTWNRWRAADPEGTRAIDLSDYQDVGGIEHALSRHAEELLAQTPPDLVAAIFKRLTARGHGNRERRDPTTLAALWSVCGATTEARRKEVVAVVDTFRSGQATFLRPLTGTLEPDTYIDITHESLIRLWTTLRDTWLPEEQQSAKMLVEVAERAANRRAGSGELLTGRDLARVDEWDRARNQSPEWAGHYVDAGTYEQVLDFIAESRRTARRRRLWRRLSIGAAVVVIGVSAATAGQMWLAERQERARLQQEAEERETAERIRVARAAQAAAEQSLLVAQTELVQVDARAETVSGGPNSSSEPPPRVYVQVRTADEASQVKVLAGPLRKVGYLLPAPQVLKTGPARSELRYFRSDERSLAETLMPILEAEGYLDVRPVFIEGLKESASVRRKHLELWLAPDDLTSLVLHLNDASPDTRKAAGRRLTRAYASSPAAVAAVLDLLSPARIRSLTADGRINALYFLNATKAGAWNDDLRARAREATLRIRSNPNAAVGPQTANELVKLEQRVALPVPAQVPAVAPAGAPAPSKIDAPTLPTPTVTGPETTIQSGNAAPIAYSASLVQQILKNPGVPYTEPPAAPQAGRSLVAIVLHDAFAADTDGSVRFLREGMKGTPGPLAHWAVRTDGQVVAIAPEAQEAKDLGRGAAGSLALTNANTIAVTTLGRPSCVDPRQVENLIRLVADIADRWNVPSANIFSHAEVALPPGRKKDMAQQAPAVRDMVEAVRRRKAK